MINKELIFTDKNIHFKDDPNKFIMMDWETPLMERHAEIVCQNGGDILELGFGMGISANYIQTHDINSHTIVELHPQVLERLYKWVEDKPNIKIIEGDWYENWEKICENKYDGIFHDTYHDKNKLKLRKFVESCIKIGGIFTYFNPTAIDQYDYNQMLKKELVMTIYDKNDYYNDLFSYCTWVNY